MMAQETVSISGPVARVAKTLDQYDSNEVKYVEITLHFDEPADAEPDAVEQAIQEPDSKPERVGGTGFTGITGDTAVHLALYELDGYLDTHDETMAAAKDLVEDGYTLFKDTDNLSTRFSTLRERGLINHAGSKNGSYAYNLTNHGRAELERLGEPQVDLIKSKYVKTGAYDQ